MSCNKITDLKDPTTSQYAVTKSYVDKYIGGGSAWLSLTPKWTLFDVDTNKRYSQKVWQRLGVPALETFRERLPRSTYQHSRRLQEL